MSSSTPARSWGVRRSPCPTSWLYQSERGYVDPRYEPNKNPLEAAGRWVARQLPPVSGRPPLIGKALGTYAASAAAEHGLPAVWLTALLAFDWLVDALRRATAPMPLVGGHGGRLLGRWSRQELSPHVLEVDGADHGVYVPGPVANSAVVLGQVVTAAEDFREGVIWPAAT